MRLLALPAELYPHILSFFPTACLLYHISFTLSTVFCRCPLEFYILQKNLDGLGFFC